MIARAVFETAPNWTTVIATANYAANTTSGRRSLTKSYINNRGSVYRTEMFEISTTGVVGASATVNYYPDILGRTIAAERANYPRNEVEYDTLSRLIRTRVKVGNVVIAMKEADYDLAGNTIGLHTYDLNPGDNTGITTNSTNYIRQSVYAWHDKANRLTPQADYGSSGANWAYYAKPARPSTAPASSSASCLVTKTAYNANTGKVDLSTDPMGRNSKTT